MRQRLIALTTVALMGVTLSACASNGSTNSLGNKEEPQALAMQGSEVITDANGSGVDASARFFETAHEVVVTDSEPAALAAGARTAIAESIPMLTVTDGANAAVVAEIARLKPKSIKTAGTVPSDVIGDHQTSVVDLTEDTERLAGLPAEKPKPPVPSEEELGELETPTDWGTTVSVASAQPGAAKTAREQVVDDTVQLESTGKNSAYVLPTVFATDESSPASIATTKAAGGDVELLDFPDPRVTSVAMKAAATADTIALGEQFGDAAHYQAVVDLADNGELPGGGGLVFPGRRMIAYYGHPSGGALGIMGELPAEESVAKVTELAQQYQQLEEQPVIPAFEVIVTVASSDAGEDGDYSNECSIEECQEYVDAITQAGGYAVLDLQPGHASLLEQAKLYEDLLKQPNVGLALDSEWKMPEGVLPMEEIGHVQAAEINEVADWLVTLVRDNNLPQKALVLHQFQLQMIRDREQVNTDHPELAFVLHVDGHGAPGVKAQTWNVMQQGLSGQWFMAWKNFIDEDEPMATPEETYNVEPRPWFVSYQ